MRAEPTRLGSRGTSEHRGGYRDAATAPSRAPQRVELPDASLGRAHLRRETDSLRVLWSIVSMGVGLLVAALFCAALGQPMWPALFGPLLALPVLAWWTRRVAHVDAIDLLALRRVQGELVRSPAFGWRFVANDGVRYALYPPGAAHSFARSGPTLAAVDERTRAALAWASLPLDDERDAALRQAELDRFFGTTAEDRACLAEGRLSIGPRNYVGSSLRPLRSAGAPAALQVLRDEHSCKLSPRMRAHAALRALVAFVVALLFAVGTLVVAWSVPPSIFFLALPALIALLAAPAVQLAWEGRCLVVEGAAYAFSEPAGRDVAHYLAVSAFVLRVPRSVASVVEPGARVRAYYDPHGLFDLPPNRRVLAVEHIAPAPRPPAEPDYAMSRWLAADARNAIEDFRRQLH